MKYFFICVFCIISNASFAQNNDDILREDFDNNNNNWQIEASGIALIVLSIIGVIIHTFFRIIFRRRCFLSKKFDGGNES